MKILFLYPNHEGYFRVPIGITLIMTVCKNAGHDVKLFDTTFIAAEDNLDTLVREKAKLTKPIPMDEMYDKHTQDEIVDLWLKKIEDFKPDLIVASILEDAYKFADTLLGAAKNKFDIVIIDAPCSSIGTIRRNPEIFYRHFAPNFQYITSIQYKFHQ